MADSNTHLGQGILKGMALTLKHFFARPVMTVQYPEQRLVNSRRIRGCELVWDKERCTGCSTCAKSCPQGNIRIETIERPDNIREPVVFEVDHGRCMFCGLCVESCPFDALHMGRNYERATYVRDNLVEQKEKVLMSGERQPSGYFRPQFEETLPLQTLLIYQIHASKSNTPKGAHQQSSDLSSPSPDQSETTRGEKVGVK